jgi:hypothetical protein
MKYRYSISGLTHGYEAGEYSPNALKFWAPYSTSRLLYNFFGTT